MGPGAARPGGVGGVAGTCCGISATAAIERRRAQSQLPNCNSVAPSGRCGTPQWPSGHAWRRGDMRPNCHA